MSAILILHIGFVGLWLGCVLTEAAFERTLLAGSREAHATLARLHLRVDLFVEVPAMLGVLTTGALLWPSAAWTAGTQAMAALGALALAANAVCVWLVVARHKAAKAGDWNRFDLLDHRQHQIGAVVLVALLGAFAAAIIF